MPLDYFLYRCRQKITLEKADTHFTALLPTQRAVELAAQQSQVKDMKQVFHNVYKIRTDSAAVDPTMEELRQNDRIPSICHHAYCPAGDPATRYYITDRVALAFAAEVPLSRKSQILGDHGLRILRFYDNHEAVCLVEVTAAAGKNPLKVSCELQEYAEIAYAEPNLVNRFQRQYQPTDNLFPYQWHLNSEPGIELLAEAGVQAPEAWKHTRGSRDITVAVIDDGFDLTHPDLDAADKIVAPFDFSDRDTVPFPTREAGNYHGTPLRRGGHWRRKRGGYRRGCTRLQLPAHTFSPCRQTTICCSIFLNGRARTRIWCPAVGARYPSTPRCRPCKTRRCAVFTAVEARMARAV